MGLSSGHQGKLVARANDWGRDLPKPQGNLVFRRELCNWTHLVFWCCPEAASFIASFQGMLYLLRLAWFGGWFLMHMDYFFSCGHQHMQNEKHFWVWVYPTPGPRSLDNDSSTTHFQAVARVDKQKHKGQTLQHPKRSSGQAWRAPVQGPQGPRGPLVASLCPKGVGPGAPRAPGPQGPLVASLCPKGVGPRAPRAPGPWGLLVASLCPKGVQPRRARPGQAVSDHAGPGQAWPRLARRGQASIRPGVAMPAASGQAGPGQAWPGAARPRLTRLGLARAGHACARRV